MPADVFGAKNSCCFKEMRDAETRAGVFIVNYVVAVRKPWVGGVQEVEDVDAGADEGSFAVGAACGREPGGMLREGRQRLGVLGQNGGGVVGG